MNILFIESFEDGARGLSRSKTLHLGVFLKVFIRRVEFCFYIFFRNLYMKNLFYGADIFY